MAWGSVGTGATRGSSVANQGSLVHTLGANGIAPGNFAVISVCQQNASSIGNIDPGVVSTVNDSAGNIWLKAKEWQNGGSLAQNGVVCSLWYTNAINTLSSATGTITATFLPGSSASFDASVTSAWIFTVGGPAYVVDSTANIVSGSSLSGSLDLNAGTTGPYLRVRAIGFRSTITTAMTTSAGWTAMDPVRATAGSPSMAFRGEFIITASSTAASNPTITSAQVNEASVYILFAETSPAVGSAIGDATADAVGSSGAATGAGDGAAQGDADASGFLSASADFAGTAQGDAAASGTLVAIGALTGTAQGDADVSGILAAIGSLVGTAQGDATADAVGSGGNVILSPGLAQGDATAAAISAAAALSPGLAQGDAVVTGALSALGSFAGSAQGDAAATAFFSGLALEAGVAQGDATAAAVSAALVRIQGTAQGDAVASAEGQVSGVNLLVGTAIGDADVSAEGAALAEAAGAVTGTGDAAAFAVGTIYGFGAGEAIGGATASAVMNIPRFRYRSKTFISPEPETTARR